MFSFRHFAATFLGTPLLLFSADPVFVLDASNPKRLNTNAAQQSDPSLRPTEGAKLGGKSTLRFDGEDFLEGPAVLAEGDDSFTVIALWKPEREGVQVVWEQAGDGGGRRGSLLQVGARYGFNGQGNDAHSLVPLAAKQWRLTAMMLTGTDRDNVVIIDNDNPPFVGSVNIQTQNLGVSGIRIGAKLTNGGERFQGEIAEIRVFADALSKGDLDQQLQELREKWKLDFKAPPIPEIVAKNEPTLVEPPTVANVEPTPEQIEFFETHVRPVLADNCYSCHSADEKQKGGLVVDSLAALLKGGDSGPALVPGKPDESPLFKGVSYLDSEFVMPPKKKLPDLAIENLRKWIEMGAPWPGGVGELADNEQTWDWEELRGSHWAWGPIDTTSDPNVSNEDWIGNDIDNYVLARLDSAGLAPSEPAPKHTLVRRTYLNLIGLPPTPEQLDSALRIPHSELVDQLLASPQYGERWARHWLDVARYSEGYGGFLDKAENQQAWRYRDWVVQALNADLPFDEFVKLQIAGDLIDPKQTVATGFFALGPQYISDGGDPDSKAMAQIETLDDRVDTLGRGLLGVTLACARCHDHKFDPFPTLDYYSIAGVFKNSPVHEFPIAPQSEVDAYNTAQKERGDFEKELNQFIDEKGNELVDIEANRLIEYMTAAVEFRQLQPRPDPVKWAREKGLAGTVFRFGFDQFGDEKNKTGFPELDPWFASRSMDAAKAFQSKVVAFRAKMKLETDEDKKIHGFITRHFKFDRNQVADDLNPEIGDEIRARKAKLEEIKKNLPPKYATVHALREGGNQNMPVALRGNLRKPGEEAPRRFLRVFGGDETALFQEGSGRLDLANAIVSQDNPLTARVFVNRVWGWHFGQAIVPTRSNFGQLGIEPSHPQLLDFLAAKFVESGWSIKELHRLILNSSTWRQSSQFDPNKFAKDGDNKLLWRMNPRKLEVEAWRDQLLAVTGELDLAMSGEPVDNLENSMRRTLYAKTSRNGDKFESDRFLQLFDFPPPRTSIAKRTPTITPQQSLFLLNNAFFKQRASMLAKRLEAEASETDTRIELAYRLLFAREPSEDERQVGVAYLSREGAAIDRYAQALLASNEFMFVE